MSTAFKGLAYFVAVLALAVGFEIPGDAAAQSRFFTLLVEGCCSRGRPK
jgi:hypothetical protein